MFLRLARLTLTNRLKAFLFNSCPRVCLCHCPLTGWLAHLTDRLIESLSKSMHLSIFQHGTARHSKAQLLLAGLAQANEPAVVVPIERKSCAVEHSFVCWTLALALSLSHSLTLTGWLVGLRVDGGCNQVTRTKRAYRCTGKVHSSYLIMKSFE